MLCHTIMYYSTIMAIYNNVCVDPNLRLKLVVCVVHKHKGC